MIRHHAAWLLILAGPLSALAQETAQSPTAEPAEIPAGHSYHGESFNEGPRQAAVLFPGNGAVHFPVTTEHADAQKFIDQGVGQLHGFWYFESERSFRQAARLDPDCAIAYWGMAMSNRNNEKRARGFIEEAVKRKDKAGKREKLHIEALAAFLKEDAAKGKDGEKNRRQKLVKAYEDILHEFPDDVETKAFLGLLLWENRGKGIPISSYFAVDALLKEVLAENPLHPCHHFRIHLWDYEKPERALDSAALCGESAPAIAHMWHMPGHIYSRLKRYHEAVWQQEASARVDHAHMMRERVLPDQIHNFAHNNEWLIRNLIFIGRAHDAVDLAKNMIDLPQHPKYNTLKKQGSGKFGRMRLFQTLVAFEMWEELTALSETRYLEPTEIESEQLNRQRHLAVARFRTGDFLQGCEILSTLKQELAGQIGERAAAEQTAAEEARKAEKSEEEVKKAEETAGRKFAERIRSLENVIHELEGHVHLAHRAYGDAVASFEKVTDLLNPGWLAEAHLLNGDREQAVKTAEKGVNSEKNETVPLARLVALHWQSGDREQAAAAFEKLLPLSATIDLDVPVFARLQPIAAELGHAGDWRRPLDYGEDFGPRPDLAGLGPFRWSPMPAESWSLPDHEGKPHALASFQGQPVIVIFYLGYGCLHCAEQLQAFAPKSDEFRSAGISLVAISTDATQELNLSHENYKDGDFPFPLLADPELDVFKKYRCHDDFENLPLHGTFLIDQHGLVRWQDISHEPFMDVDFLVQESRRLLAQPLPSPGEREHRQVQFSQ